MLFQHVSTPNTKGGMVKICVFSFNSKPYETIESLGTTIVTTYWCLSELNLCYSNMF